MGLAKPVSPVLQRGNSLTNGLVGAWPFYEGSGGTLNDLSGYGNTGTLSNAPTWQGGQAGFVLSFSGTNNVFLPASPSLNIAGPITMAAWVQTTNTGFNAVIGGYAVGGSFPGYGFLIGFPNVGTPGYWSGTHAAWVSANSTVNDGNWHFITVSETGGIATFYKDGVPDGAVATNDPNAFSGTRRIGSDSDGSNPFHGQIDGVLIYNRALSAAEIAQLYLDTFVIYRSRSRWWEVSTATPFTYFPLTQPDEAWRLRKPEMVGY